MTGSEGVRTRPPAQLDSRMLVSGVDFLDLAALTERCVRGDEDWVAVCEQLGDRRFRYAEQERDKGHSETARYFYFTAQAAYRVGQYGLVEVTDERLRLYRKLDDSFHSFAKLCDPPLEKVEIPYQGYTMEGWLIQGKDQVNEGPVVLMLPGATGFKEEFFLQAQNMVDRGLSVLLMDGPGQGTTLYFNKGYLEINIENAYSKMVDHLEMDGRFAAIGIIGGSTGGYYVARAAAVDSRIKACVWNSGSYYPQEICDFAEIYAHKFALLYGVADDEMGDIWPQMTLEGYAEKIECPLLIVHSESDPIFSLKGAQRTFDEAKSADKELKIYPGTRHCQGGAETEAFRYMADWMADRLKLASG